MKKMFAAMVAALLMVGLVSSTVLASPGSSSGGSAKAVYNAIPSKVSGNVPSISFEATGTYEFGDAVGLGGTARTLQSMTVLMSSWACESGSWYNNGTNAAIDCVTTPGATFSWPLTFTIYDFTGNTKGAVLARGTQYFNIAYRPSASTLCADGRWYNSKDKTCYNGFPQTVTMPMTAAAPLPAQVIWTIAYNTSDYGATPQRPQPCNATTTGCPYDSLNVGAFSFPNAPYVGTDLNEDQAFVNGVMQNGWTGYRPLGAITAK